MLFINFDAKITFFDNLKKKNQYIYNKKKIDMNWYVIRVASGKEKKIKELIENQLVKTNNQDLISTLLIPTEKAIQMRRGKKICVEKNFFPGYLFVECNSISDVEKNVKHIIGISSVLKSPLGQEEIDRILLRENKKEIEDSLMVNQKVKIIDGPFTSCIGTIKTLDINKLKVKVSVVIFERETLLDLKVDQITKAD
jgi:transcription termination/antitermination protein NusG